MKTTTILHLSDLHLGDDIVWRAIYRWRPWWKHVSPGITRGLVSAIRELHPDYIVISGDIVNKPEAEWFDFSARYLRDLFLNSGFDLKERLLIIPGNHDVSFRPKKQPDDFVRVSLFRGFLRDLFGESDTESRSQRFFKVDTDAGIIFFCLDTTLKEQPPLAEGEVGASQRAWIKREMERISKELGGDISRYAKVAVMHHHCVPIPGTSTFGERFMQLLDAGDVLELLNGLGFNVVLHGHKHFPHSSPKMRSDSSMLTVVGAGTSTCVFPEEQRGMGNNFNLVRISPQVNELVVELYRANENGEFIASGDIKSYPLFRVVPLGFSAELMRKVVTIKEDGTKRVKIIKAGLRVEEIGKTMSSLPLRVITDAAGSKITDFEAETSSAQISFSAKTDTAIEGKWVLKSPLTKGSPPIDVAYSYTVRDGTAMTQAQMIKLYSAGTDLESTGVVITHPTQALVMEVFFPEGFPTTVEARVEHLGSKIQLNPGQQSLNHDKILNTCKLEVRNPPFDHSFLLKWTLPTTWP